jgi:hypothetical protein
VATEMEREGTGAAVSTSANTEPTGNDGEGGGCRAKIGAGGRLVGKGGTVSIPAGGGAGIG